MTYTTKDDNVIPLRAAVHAVKLGIRNIISVIGQETSRDFKII